MANTLLLKRSSQTGETPTSGELSYGELAINYNDGKLFFKNSGDSVVEFLSSPGTAAGQALFSNGSTFTGDNAFFWDNTNKRLGIGTTSPNRHLEIANAADAMMRLSADTDNNTGAADAAIDFFNNGGELGFAGLREAYGSGGNAFVIATTASRTNRLLIQQDGKVGIGTGTPNRTLSVSTNLAKTSTTTAYPFSISSNESSGMAQLSIHAVGGASAAVRYWTFQTEESGVANAGNLVFQQHGGNVGIGVSDPDEKLEVVGNIKTSGSITSGTHISVGSSIDMVNGGSINCGDSGSGELLIYGGGTYKGGYINLRAGGNSGDIRMYTSGASATSNLALTIDSSQNATFTGAVGIGNTAPEADLHIGSWQSGTGQTATIRLSEGNGGGDSAGFDIKYVGGSDALFFTSKDGSGNFVDRLNINRDTGAATFSGDVTITKSSGEAKFGISGTTYSTINFKEGGTDQWNVGYDAGNNKFFIAEDGVANQLEIADGGNATFAGNLTVGGGTAKHSLTVDGTGSGWTGADIIFQTGHGNRGGGMFIYNTATDHEWYWGTPYQTSNVMHLCYESTSAFTQQTAETTHSVFSVNTSGYATFAGNITVGDTSANSALTILAPDAGNSRLYFGDASDSGIGFIDYDHGTSMILGTAGSATLTLGEDKNATFAGTITSGLINGLYINAGGIGDADSGGTQRIGGEGRTHLGGYIKSYGGNAGGKLEIYSGTSGAGTLALTIDSSQNSTFAGDIDMGGDYLTISHSAQNGIKLKGDDTACIFSYDKTSDAITGAINWNHVDGTTTFMTNGMNERMRIEAGGNVGIGITNPEVKLAVGGMLGVTSQLHLGSNAGQVNGGSLYIDSTDYDFTVKQYSSTASAWVSSLSIDKDSSEATFAGEIDSDHHDITTTATEKGLSIINTNLASALRQIDIFIDSNGKGCIRKTSAAGLDNDLYIQPDHGNVYFKGSGNVGIGGVLTAERRLHISETSGSTYVRIGNALSDPAILEFEASRSPGSSQQHSMGEIRWSNNNFTNTPISIVGYIGGSGAAQKLGVSFDGTEKFSVDQNGNGTFAGTISNTGLIYSQQTAHADGIRFRGYDAANGYYGKIGLIDNGYLRIHAEGNRSIDLYSGRQIRFYTSTDNSTYNNSVNFNDDGTSTFNGTIKSDHIWIHDPSTGQWGGRIQYSDSGNLLSIQANEVAGDDMELFASDKIFLKTGSGTVVTLDDLTTTFAGEVALGDESSARGGKRSGWSFAASSSGGTAPSGGGMILAMLGDNYTTSDGILHVKNGGNRGTVGHASGSPLFIAEFSNHVAMKIDKGGVTNFGGNVLPTTDNTRDLGSSSLRWANLYVGDMHLKNDRGDWTVIEEEDYLSLKNNKNGKTYKLVMEEV